MTKRALISVYDKDGVVELARKLKNMGWEILSSSGTAKVLSDSGIEVREVAEVTSYPHILGGRVKTLHPAIAGGILARRHLSEDVADVEKFNIPLIDMVVCNLYPFEETVRGGADLDTLLENIDIGGVTLIRAAAKNFNQVVVITDPADYEPLIEELHTQGAIETPSRERLALKAFAYTAAYDSTIYEGLSNNIGEDRSKMDDILPLTLRKVQPLRYGENPHQKASLYLPALADLPWEQLSGKPLSYNNILDLDGAMRGIALMQRDCGAVVLKHTTPCGMAMGNSLVEAYKKAIACDPLSAFGGIVGLTRTMDMETAEAISERFTEVVIAPDYEDAALKFLSEKKHNLRLLRWKGGKVLPWQLTGTWSGLLAQQDVLPPLPAADKGKWIGTPRPDLWDDLLFAWKVAFVSKSNAVSLVQKGAAVGIGMGFCSRVFAVNFAVEQAGEKAQSSVMASDAFFPFPDGVEAAAKAGVTAIIQPGGSINDEKVFKRAEELGISMFISDWRTFRH